MRRTISVVSRIRCNGRSNGMPCHPSITCGPLTPRPRRNRPFDIASRLIAVIATSAGVRVPACMIAVPSLTRDGARRHEGDRRRRVVAPRLRGPDVVDAETLRLDRVRGHLVPVVVRQSQRDAETHHANAAVIF
jgi:hypothetical protein